MANPTTLKLGAWNTLTDGFVAHSASPAGTIIDLQDGTNWTITDTTGKGGGLNWGEVRPTVLDVGNPRTIGRTVVRRIYDSNRTIQVSLMWLGNTSGTTYAQWITTLHNLVQTLEGISQSQPAALQFQPTGSSTPLYFDVLEAHLIFPLQELTYAQQIVDEVMLECVCKPFLRGARQTLSNAVTNPGFEAPSGPGVTVFNDPLASFNAYVPQQYQAAVASDTPLRYYRMQEVTGTTALDSGSALVNGTYNGGVTLGVAGICGGASFGATFNGSTGYLSAAGTGLPSGNGAFTLETWINSAANPGGTVDVMMLGTASTNQAILVQLNATGHIVTLFQGGSSVTSTGALTTSAWHHVAVTWNGTTLTLYVDGASTGTPITPGAANLTLGSLTAAAAIGGGSFYSGTLDEVAVYNAALSSARVLAHYNAGSPTTLAQDTYQFPDAVTALQGAVGQSSTTVSVLRYYRLDETSGTTCYDASGQGQNGTTHGGPTQGVASLLTGDADPCYTFASASGQYVSCATAGLPTGNNPWWMAGWFKYAAAGASNMVIGFFGTNTNKEFGELYLDTSGKLNGQIGGTTITSGAAVSTGAAHFGALTWDGTTLTLYLDNTTVGTATPGALAIVAGTAGFGAFTGGPSLFWNGQLDECLMGSGCPTAAQMTALYNAGHVAPAATSNTLAIPSGGRVSFGSPAWGAINTWQVRWRWVTGLTATFYLHYTDANNYLAASVTGTALTVNQVVGGVTHQVGTQALTLINGRQYWLQVTQFPALIQQACFIQAQLFYDSNGTVGSSVASAVGPSLTFNGVTALSGCPQMAASGASLGVGGNFSSVHSVSLFGPGGWTMTESQNGVSGLVSGAWDGQRTEIGMSGTATTGTQTYGLGSVTSFGSGRMDLPPGGTVDALWQLYTGGGTPATLNPVPVQTATNVLGYSLYVKESGLATNATVALYITEYNSGGTSLRNSGNLGALTGGTLPTSWTQISGTYTTGANCAYVDIALRVVDTTIAAESANGIVWWDNAQVWDQTRTGMTTMPYCELRFPQSPAQLLVNGVVGDVPSQITVAQIGVYFASWAASQTGTVYFGRRAATSPGSTLVVPSLNTAPSLDTTAYGGFVSGANPGAITMTDSDADGTYHLLCRGKTANVTPTAVGVLPDTLTYAISAGQTAQLAYVLDTYYTETEGLTVYPFAAQNTWTSFDAGQTVCPPNALGSLTSGSGIGVFASTLSTGSSQITANYFALLPIDAEVLIIKLANPSNGLTFTQKWLHLYLDGTQHASGYSAETGAIPMPSHALTALATGGNQGTIAAAPLADAGILLDPTLHTATSRGLGVNQFCVLATDNTALIIPTSVEIAYSPLYLYPE